MLILSSSNAARLQLQDYLLNSIQQMSSICKYLDAPGCLRIIEEKPFVHGVHSDRKGH